MPFITFSLYDLRSIAGPFVETLLWSLVDLATLLSSFDDLATASWLLDDLAMTETSSCFSWSDITKLDSALSSDFVCPSTELSTGFEWESLCSTLATSRSAEFDSHLATSPSPFAATTFSSTSGGISVLSSNLGMTSMMMTGSSTVIDATICSSFGVTSTSLMTSSVKLVMLVFFLTSFESVLSSKSSARLAGAAMNKRCATRTLEQSWSILSN